jgi:hypothetical protein
VTISADADGLAAVPGTNPRVPGTEAVIDSVGPDALDQALALEDFFRNDGFTYSMSTPAREDYDGDSGAVIARVTEDAATVLRGLRRSTSWRARLVAWWSPRSQRSPRRSNSNPHPGQ